MAGRDRAAGGCRAGADRGSAVSDSGVAREPGGVADAVLAFDPSLIVLCQRGHLEWESQQRGLPVGMVFLGDRAYGDDGMPVSRSLPGSLLHDAGEVAERCVRIVEEGMVRSIDGNDVPLGHDVDSILIHGDNKDALAISSALRAGLAAADIEAVGLQRVLAAKSSVAV